MKQKQIRYLYTGLMVLLIVAGIVGGIFFVGHIRGWLPEKMATKTKTAVLTLKAESLTGTVLVERSGISYQLQRGDNLKSGDEVACKGHGTATFLNGDTALFCGENTAFQLKATEKNFLQVTVTQGELFGRSGEKNTLRFVLGDQPAELQKGTADLTVSEHQQMLRVLSGSVAFPEGGGSGISGTLKEHMQVCRKNGQWNDPLMQNWSLKKMSDFTLQCAEKYKDLCVSQAQIKAEQRRREQAAQVTLEAKLKKETQEKQEKKQSAQTKETEQKGPKTSEKETTEKQNKTSVAAGEKLDQQTSKAKEQIQEKKSEKKADKKNTEKESNQNQNETETNTQSGGSCTIRIECSTILDNMDNLKESKRGYVPANGVILKKTKASFSKGETVYDVLTRTCKAAGVQMEVSYSGSYDSDYVEGIGHLYEFDCGRQSGWLYKVNGALPNCGCSSYTVTDGAYIEWSYTCKGLGSDVK